MRKPKAKMQDAEVKFYSGYKGRETPSSIIIDDTEYPIDEILSQKRVRDQKSGKISDIFECRAHKKYFRITVSKSRVSVSIRKRD